jgi:uncharacterized protein YdeI (BOF family)
MNTFVIAIVLAFSLSMLSSCSREESPPVSGKQDKNGVAGDSTKQVGKDTERTGTTRDSSKEAAKGTESATTTGERRSGTPTSDSPSATPGAMGGRVDRDVSGTAPSTADGKRTSADRAAASGEKTVAEEIASNRMVTIEGVLTKIDGDSYLVKEVSGTEVKVRADNKTKKDSNLTVGDTIVARLEGPGAAAASITKRRHAGALHAERSASSPFRIVVYAPLST